MLMTSCPVCRAQLVVLKPREGKKIKCGGCNTRFKYYHDAPPEILSVGHQPPSPAQEQDEARDAPREDNAHAHPPPTPPAPTDPAKSPPRPGAPSHHRRNGTETVPREEKDETEETRPSAIPPIKPNSFKFPEPQPATSGPPRRTREGRTRTALVVSADKFSVSLPVLAGAVVAAFAAGLLAGLFMGKTPGKPEAPPISAGAGPKNYRSIGEIRPTSQLQVGDAVGPWKLTARRSELDSSIQGDWKIVAISRDEDGTTESLSTGASFLTASARRLSVVNGEKLLIGSVWTLQKNEDWSARLLRFTNTDRFCFVAMRQNDSYYLFQTMTPSGKEVMKLIFEVVK